MPNLELCQLILKNKKGFKMTAIIVYLAVNLVLMMIAILLNYEQDKDDPKRFFVAVRCSLRLVCSWSLSGVFINFLR